VDTVVPFVLRVANNGEAHRLARASRDRGQRRNAGVQKLLNRTRGGGC
jgi:hypothetical protein